MQPATSPTPSSIDLQTIPLTIVNKNSRKKLFVRITGTTHPKSPEHNTYYLADFNGTIKLCTPTPKASYSLAAPADEFTLKLPQLAGVRIYLSFDQPLYFVVGDNGIPNAPNGMNDGYNFHTLYDFIESTWEISAEKGNSLGANTSQVDFFGFPMCIELTGQDPVGKKVTKQSGFNSGDVRKLIFDSISNAGEPWSGLIVADNQERYRIHSPYHGMEDENTFPKNMLEEYINNVWDHYKKKTLIASVENVTYQGQVNQDDVWVFVPQQAGESIRFAKPSSKQLYEEGPIPAAITDQANVIKAALQAAFLRSTLLVSSNVPECNTSLYYSNDPINLYAKTIHQYGIEHKAYAFGFDDVCEQSSVNVVFEPESMRITIYDF